jgi:integrase
MGKETKLSMLLHQMEEHGYSTSPLNDTKRWVSRYLQFKDAHPHLSDNEIVDVLSQAKSPAVSSSIRRAISNYLRYVSTGIAPTPCRKKDCSYLLDEPSANWKTFFAYAEQSFAKSTIKGWKRIAYVILEVKLENSDLSYGEIVTLLGKRYHGNTYASVKHVAGQMAYFERTGECLPLKKHSVKRINKYGRLSSDKKAKWDRLLSGLCANGNKPSTIRFMRNLIGRVEAMRRDNPSISYEDIQSCISKNLITRANQRELARSLRIMEAYEETGILPKGHAPQNRKTIPTLQLGDEFRHIVENYEISCHANIYRKKTSIYSAVRVLVNQLLRLQAMGIKNISEIQETHLTELFSRFKGPSTPQIVKNALLLCRDNDECARVARLIPIKRRKRPNIQRLTPSEFEAIKETLSSDDTSLLSLRDKAIGILALFTALRRCDIVALKLDDIDWQEETITVQQQKTGVRFVLPLRPNVGNALYDYITLERPKSQDREVFLSTINQHVWGSHKMSAQSLYDVSVKICKCAGIRQNKEDRKGLHIFRHNVATSMLERDVPLPVISHTLGHSNPESLNAYLGADMKHLKECALSIAEYPIRKEVFDD